jgi:hypothetical protein
MNATTTHPGISTLSEIDHTMESIQNDRFVRNNILSELPGAIFAAITLLYVVSSLISLA